MSLVALVAVMGSAVWAIESGNGGQLAVWGLTFGTLAFVPAALQGLINVRFPSGRPTGRWGRILDRAITWGIVLGLLGGLLGDRTITAVYPQGVPGGAARFVDGTPAVAVGNGLIVVVPVVILLGVLAGIGIIVRCFRAEGLERQQLEWRAAGVAYGLLLFPFAVTESLPDWLADLEPAPVRVDAGDPGAALRPVGDRHPDPTLGRLHPGGHGVHRREHDARRGGDAAASVRRRAPRGGGARVVRRGDGPMSRCGRWSTRVSRLGTLVAAPRRGRRHWTAGERQVLATLAELVAGSVRAEALTADLLDARQRLVSTREEERTAAAS